MKHLHHTLGGCASASHPNAVTSPNDFILVDCPICAAAIRVQEVGR